MAPEGPNWFWRLAELWGVTWPGHAQRKAEQVAAPRCGACHNATTREPGTGEWRCPYHPQAPLLTEPSGSGTS